MSRENTYDLIIIGGGIAGLTAAIAAANEGLRTCVLEGSERFGGQTSTVKNVLIVPGHYGGISGADLMQQALAQARDFEVQLLAPYRVVQMNDMPEGGFLVRTSHMADFDARCVLVTAGVRYRRLSAPNVASFLGHGVSYGELPETLNDTDSVCIVGGGNSAAQAAIALANKKICSIQMLVRGCLDEGSMSAHHLARIRASPDIKVHEGVEVINARGGLFLERIEIRENETTIQRLIPATKLLVSIGADPRLEWAGNSLLLDKHGYVLTGRDVEKNPRWANVIRPPGSRIPPTPLDYESTPGVFAAGDLQSGSAKRIGSAIGAATGAVHVILQYLGRR